MYWITLWERQDTGIFKDEKLGVTLWRTRFGRGYVHFPRYTTIYHHDIQRYTTICHDIPPRYTTIYHHDIPRYTTTIYHDMNEYKEKEIGSP
jgi:hypothetical protein